MITHIREWLTQSGIAGECEITPMTAGLGKTMLWKVSEATGGRDLVVRVFPEHDTEVAKREASAMRIAREHGVPVPEIVATGTISGQPVMLTAFAPGETVAAALARNPERANALGRELGLLLGKLHDIPAPDGLASPERWVERAGSALGPLRDRLSALPRADRLLHLDYHPENVLVRDGEVTAIVDWTNTLPGPPHIDLGRSRAILQMIPSLKTVPDEVAETAARFEEGLVAGHASVQGDDPAPELSLAWGVGMMVVDLAPHVKNAGRWVTGEMIRALEEKRDRLIASVVGG